MPGKTSPKDPAPALDKPRIAQLRAVLRRAASRPLGGTGWQPSALEIFHLGLLAIGFLAGGGRVPGVALLAGGAGLAMTTLPRVDIHAMWRRERRFVACCSREMVLATLAIYIDSIAVYMVAVLNEHRAENIELQDNVRFVLEAICRSLPGVEALFLRFPELYAEEAIVLAAALGLLAAVREDGGCSFLALVARAARVLRWCRLLRIACFTSTVMPSQTRNCFLNRYDATYSVTEHWREALSHWRVGGGCNDLVFSGHLVILSLCALLHGAHAEGSWLPALLWCRTVHAALRIIHGRFHMSVDVVVAVAVTCLVWHALPPPWPDGAEGAPLRPLGEGDADGLEPWQEEESPDLEELSETPPRCDCTAQRGIWRDRKVRVWVGALVVTALSGFGMLAVGSAQGGPLSAYNRERLHLISVSDRGGASGPASLAEQPKRQRLFCAMLHIEEADSVRAGYASAVADTWGRHCGGLLLWDERRADIAPLDSEAAKDEPATDSPPNDRWLRVRRMWRYIGRHALPRYDWFIAVDDGGFVMAENLLRATAALEAGHKPGQPLYLVDKDSYAPWGYVLNAPAVSELLQAIDGRSAQGAPEGSQACPVPSRLGTAGNAEYKTIQRCLTKARGIQATSWEADPAVREALGCRRGDASVVNLKAWEESRKLCKHAVLAYMIPRPSWVREIFQEVYGSKAAGKGRQGDHTKRG